MTTRDTDITGVWIGIGDAARLLGVSVDTIRRWDSEGRMVSRRTLGNQRRFNKADIERLLTKGAA